MDRAVRVVRQFAAVSRAAGAQEIVAVATAATREADNRQVFLDGLRRKLASMCTSCPARKRRA